MSRLPASRRSLDVTRQYRQRVGAIRSRVQAQAAREWPTIEGLDGSRWPARMAAAVAGAQTEAVRATAGYLTAYLATETGRRSRAVAIDTRRYAGVSRDGRPLAEAFESALIGVRAALAQGRPVEEALRSGLGRGQRIVGVDLDHAHRSALMDTLDRDDRFAGWERVTAGTCGACLALSGSTTGSFDTHPGCNCTPQPRVRGVPTVVKVATGIELFRALSRDEQDARFGPERAEALRAGDLEIGSLVRRNRLATGATDFITEAPAPPDAA